LRLGRKIRLARLDEAFRRAPAFELANVERVESILLQFHLARVKSEAGDVLDLRQSFARVSCRITLTGGSMRNNAHARATNSDGIIRRK
jgi:hypothetical protein